MGVVVVGCQEENKGESKWIVKNDEIEELSEVKENCI